jgi:hypothetical protein
LRKWAKSLGAFAAHRCFFQRVGEPHNGNVHRAFPRRISTVESACGTSPRSVIFNYA